MELDYIHTSLHFVS